MRFDISVDILVRQSDKTELIQAYIPEPKFLFAICKRTNEWGNLRWALVHRPSEEVVLDLFVKKSEVEKYFDFFKNEIDVDSILLISPDLSHMEDEFESAKKNAYEKYRAFTYFKI